MAPAQVDLQQLAQRLKELSNEQSRRDLQLAYDSDEETAVAVALSVTAPVEQGDELACTSWAPTPCSQNRTPSSTMPRNHALEDSDDLERALSFAGEESATDSDVAQALRNFVDESTVAGAAPETSQCARADPLLRKPARGATKQGIITGGCMLVVAGGASLLAYLLV
uniref:Uncharacterized protein n=1 Tax=Oxyrrhis marina TaxID=2969 RepID=A0A7S3XI25_OXYMA|mmetsp:Transcript_2080/g.3137  ORF Transcript_2080/g.3137 Transcript_2080/m.3137 type:complete len:168 (+) Transcript_2080:46-549(+)